MTAVLVKSRHILYVLCFLDYGISYGVLAGLITGFFLSRKDEQASKAGRRCLYATLISLALAMGIGSYPGLDLGGERMYVLIALAVLTILLIVLAAYAYRRKSHVPLYVFSALSMAYLGNVFGLVLGIMHWFKDRRLAKLLIFWALLIPVLAFILRLLIYISVYGPNGQYGPIALIAGVIVALIVLMIWLLKKPKIAKAPSKKK